MEPALDRVDRAREGRLDTVREGRDDLLPGLEEPRDGPRDGVLDGCDAVREGRLHGLEPLPDAGGDIRDAGDELVLDRGEPPACEVIQEREARRIDALDALDRRRCRAAYSAAV